MREWLRLNWHHMLFAATASGVLALAGFLVWAGLDPVWQPRFAQFPPVIGALLGPFLGLMAILLGALYNAKLNRDRDDWLREQEAQSLAAALHAEMLASLMILEHMLDTVKNHGRKGGGGLPDDYDAARNVWTLKMPVFKANLARLGILGGTLDSNVMLLVQRMETQSAMSIYNLYMVKDHKSACEDAIVHVEQTIKVIKKTAEALRKYAQVPPT